MPAPCPTPDELRLFYQAELDEQSLSVVASHVDACQTCQGVLQTVSAGSSDTILSALQHRPGYDPFADESGCRDAVARAEALVNVRGSAGDGSSGTELTMNRDEQRPGTISPASFIVALPDVAASMAGDQLGGIALAESEPAAKMIREYKLLTMLGEGGMGAVYKAQHTRLDKTVALKVLATDRMRDKGAVARFQREMKAVGRLEHPNIVRAMDAGEADGMHFLVMEYVPGIDLSVLSRCVSPLPVADACELIRQAAMGLQEAHEHGMVHRDIKPSNLILAQPQRKREVPSVKILDLGLALLSEAFSPDQQGLTSTGQIMGTLDYMAPEQGGDCHLVDIRADVYSLGATLYKLLCGEAPFASAANDTPVKKLMALATHTPAPLNSRRSDVPPKLSAIVQRMLAKKPDERFSTPEDVADALAPFCVGADLAELLFQAGVGATRGPSAANINDNRADTRANLSSGSVDTSDRVPAAAANLTADRSKRKAIAAGGWNRLPPRVKTLALAAAGGLAAILLGVVLFWQTKNGTVRIEINDPAITAQFDKDSLVIRGADKEPITLKIGDQVAAGKQKLLVRRADFEFETDTFELKKSGETAIKIEWLAGKPTVVADGQSIETRQVAPLAAAAAQSPAASDPIVTHVSPSSVPPPAPRFALDFNVRSEHGNARVEMPKLLQGDEPYTAEMYLTPRDKVAANKHQVLFTLAGATTVKIRDGHFQMSEPLDTARVREIQARDAVGLNRRTHLAAVSTGKEYRLYVDGYLMGKLAVETKAQANRSCYLGGWNIANLDWQPFDGLVDDFRLSKTARYDKDFKPAKLLEPDNDTLIQYDFHRGEGEILHDRSGNAHHGKIVGAKWVRADQQAPPTHSEGIRFDGKDSSVEIPGLRYDGSHPITLESWVRVEAAQGRSFIAGWAGLASLYLWEDEKFHAVAFDENGKGEASRAPMDEPKLIKWHHVALVWDKQRLCVFVDGKAGPTRPFPVIRNVIGVPGIFEDHFSLGAGIAIGKQWNRARSEFVIGSLKEVRVSKVARYDKDFTPKARFEPDADTMGLYHCDEGQGDVLNDSSGNNHHGKIVGAKWVRTDGDNSAMPLSLPGRDYGLSYQGKNNFLEPASGFTQFAIHEPWTIEGWVGVDPAGLVDSGGQGYLIFSERDFSVSPKLINNQALYWTLKGGRANSVLSQDPIVPHQAQHVAVTYDKSKLRLFVAGKLQCEQAVQFGESLIAFSPGPNSWSASGDRLGFHGTLAEIRLSNSVRYQSTFTPPLKMIADDKTLALYHLDEGQGTQAKDSSSRANHAKIISAKWVGSTIAPVVAPKKFALDFNVQLAGNDSGFVALPRVMQPSQPFTVEMYVTPRGNADNTNHCLFGMIRGPIIKTTGDNFLVMHTHPKGDGSYNQIIARNRITLGKRMHVAGVSTGNELRLFADGYLVGSCAQEPASTELQAGRFGGNVSSGPTWRPFDGLIDDFRISKTARYEQNFTPAARLEADANTLLAYDFHEGEGDLLHDRSGNAHHGRIVGAKWVTADGATLADSEGWTSLFDGKTLNGWETVGEGGWSAADGILKAAGTGKGWIGTTRTFKDYELELEYRIQAQGNGGIALRAWKDGGISAKPFFEVQILDDQVIKNSDPTGSITGHVVAKPGFKAPLGEWNKVTVRLEGKRALVKFNGTTTVDADLPIERTDGLIGLQVWDQPVEYRNIRVRGLSKPQSAAVNAQSKTIPSEALTFGGHRYLLVDSPGNWGEAKAKAEALGGHLAAINSKEERDWLRENVIRKRPLRPEGVFLGGVGNDQVFSWVTGEPFDETLWLFKATETKPGRSYLCWISDNYWNNEWGHARMQYLLVEWDTLGPELTAAQSSSSAQIAKDPNATSVTKSAQTPAAWAALDFNAKFDTGTARVHLPKLLDGDEPMTIELAVTPRAKPTSNQMLFSLTGSLILKTAGSNGNIYWSGPRKDDGQYVQVHASGAMQPGKRIHVAGVSTGKELRLFVNGYFMGKTEATMTPNVAGYCLLGGMKNDDPTWEPLDALIDEVRVSKTARYDKDYKPAERLLPDSETLMLYDFHQGEGDLLLDRSGKANHGKIYGAKWATSEK